MAAEAFVGRRRGKPRLYSELVFARYEYWLWWIYVLCGGETGLIQGEAGSSARIDKQQRLFERHIAERPHEWHLDFASGNRDLQPVAELIPELQKIFAADVCDQVAERTVEGDHLTGQAFVVHGWRF